MLFAKDDEINLTQKASLNVIAALLDYAVRVAVSFIITPFLVQGLGSTVYGIWKILQRSVGILTFSDGKPTQALKWLVANRQANSDDELKRREVGSALLFWLVFIPILIPISGVFVWLSPDIANADAHMANAVRLAASILVFAVLLSGLTGLAQAVLGGSNLGYKRMGVIASLNIVQGILMAAAVYWGLGLVGLAFTRLIILIMGGILFWNIAKKAVAWFGISRPLWHEIRSYFGLNLFYFLWNLLNRGMTSIDVVIIGFFLSPAIVTTYTLTAYSSQFLNGITLVTIGAIMPGLGGIVGNKNHQEVLNLRSEIVSYIWLLITAIGSTILLWNRSFMYLWVGKIHYAGAFINFLIVLLIAQWMIILNDARIVDLTLQLRRKVLLGAISLLVALGSAVILVPRLGLSGLCLSLLAGRFILSISYPAMIGTLFGSTLKHQIVRSVKPLLITLILFSVSAWLSTRILFDQWQWLILAVVFTCLFLAIFLFYIGLSEQQRHSFYRRTKNILSNAR